VSALPILKADCIKFVSVFRQHLPSDAYSALIPLIARFLTSEHYVVRVGTHRCLLFRTI